MRFLIDPARPFATSIRSLCAMIVLLGLIGGSCSEAPSDGDGAGQVEPPPTSGAPVVTIISPTLSRNIPAGSTITITYSVTNSPTDVVAFIDVDADPTNDNEIVFARDLLSGTNRTVNFVSAGIVPGVYNIGIRAINSSGTTIALAQTSARELVTITVNGLPQPVINSPSNNLEVLLGSASTIAVVFSCNDAENVVSWKVFFDTDQVIDGTEITIENGTGNADPGSFNTTVNWPTLTVPEGDYSIGLLCTDSAQSQAVAYAAGKVKISSELSIPSLEVTAPAENRVAFPDEQIEINFAASSTSTVGATITLFLDLDNNGFDGSEPLIASGLPLSTTTTTVNSSIIPDGVYFIGGFVEQGTRRSAADYAPGKLTVVGVGDLVVTKPAEPLTVTPGTNVSIGWNTNIPNGQGLIDLTLFTADADGIPGLPVPSDPLADQKDLEISPSTATLNTSSLSSGFYVVRVELTPVDENDVPTGEEIESVFSKAIRITTLPTVLWVGSIELDEGQAGNPPLGHFDGVVFEGVNNEDNAGSSMLGLPELENGAVGTGGFIIASRFGKPFFLNPNGIGQGIAYLIYDNIGGINRRYSLNGVGSDDAGGNALPGLQFAGIAFDPDPEEVVSLGIGESLDFLSEDVDGDGRLDFFDEDLDGNGLLEPLEDVDGDGSLDFVEDGWLGVDADGDGIIDDPTQRCFMPQYENGALDTHLSEDRDSDGQLDPEGDATWGLSTLGLLPDMDSDGVPELVFGFEFTDSLTADFRSKLTGELDVPDFGVLTQENQFERGGIVVVPTNPDPDPNVLEAGDDFTTFPQVTDLDRVGQHFDLVADDGGGGDDDPDSTTGIVPPASTQVREPLNGHDVIMWARNNMNSVPDVTCANDQVQLYFVNNSLSSNPARSSYTVFTTSADGEEGDGEEVTLTAFPRATASECLDLDDGETLRIVPNFGEGVAILNPDRTPATPIEFVVEDLRTATPLLSGGGVAYGIVGFEETLRAVDSSSTLGFGNCVPGSGDACFETLTGPFYGFLNAVQNRNGFFEFESPTHPLAYRRTLANPLRFPSLSELCFGDRGDPLGEGIALASVYGVLNAACNDCGRVLWDTSTIIQAGAPAFDTPELLSTGYYPGEPVAPHGARILGQRAGDRFGTVVSMSPGSDRRVFVGAPMRPADASLEQAGAIYQIAMPGTTQSPRPFWDSRGDFLFFNDDDVPKPHQYIVKEVGSLRPDFLEELDGPRSVLREAIVYAGADAGDRLGEAVVGILDFNSDAQPDVFMGAPGADGKDNASPDSGAAYVVYRLPASIEASVSLEKLDLDASDPNRLNGMLINGDPGDQLGRILAGNCDVNGDGKDDLIMGVPLHGADDAGEVVVLLGGPNLASPGGGFSIQQLVDLGRAIRIQGAFGGDQAGFNVACNGDFDGDGIDDLVLSAPFATPRFDSDGDDILDSPGLDLNRDGLVDLDEGGSPLIADPSEAGLVYVIINGEDLSGTLSLSQMGGALQGFIIAGNKGGDNMGGGFETKRMTRSQGLAYAGDVNGDGKSDLLVSSILADPIISGAATPKTNAGEVYLIHGFNAQQAAGFVSGD